MNQVLRSYRTSAILTVFFFFTHMEERYLKNKKNGERPAKHQIGKDETDHSFLTQLVFKRSRNVITGRPSFFFFVLKIMNRGKKECIIILIANNEVTLRVIMFFANNMFLNESLWR